MNLKDRIIRCKFKKDAHGKICELQTSESKRQGSTSNMQMHLQKHDITKEISDTPAKRNTFSTNSQSYKEIKEQRTLIFLLQTLEPFSLVEEPSFQRLVFEIEEQTVRCRQIVKKLMLQGFAEEKHKLK
ncbi:hypothetical protein K3495_g1899 [Podosphaera aphanis]|nr:hypothetical protein K3495_g1899 [Podosphaera aphanis]